MVELWLIYLFAYFTIGFFVRNGERIIMLLHNNFMSHPIFKTRIMSIFDGA